MGARLWMEAGLWDTGLKRKIMADEKDPDAGWRGREENWQLPVALTFPASLGSAVTFLSRSKAIQLNRVPLAEPPVCCLRLFQKPLACWNYRTAMACPGVTACQKTCSDTVAYPCCTVYCGTLKYFRHVERRVQIPWHVHAVQYTVECGRSVQSIVTCRCGLYFVVICRIVSAVVDTTLNDDFAVIINVSLNKVMLKLLYITIL